MPRGLFARSDQLFLDRLDGCGTGRAVGVGKQGAHRLSGSGDRRERRAHPVGVETLVDLDPGIELPVGLRVSVYFQLDAVD